MSIIHSLTIDDLLKSYRSGEFTPRRLIESLLDRLDVAPERHIWITRLSRERVLQYVTALETKNVDELPLFGIPFAIKDNIDLQDVPTTAACPDFAYTPQHSATVVQKLIDAGAIPLGKTNMDQFATGLVGVRSPYGACQNSFDAAYISGGSSSGSAVAVATGLVSFALGTDTAGSGRVPAAFNNIVGLKPSCGRLSSRGVVPACRSLDCVSIFSLTAGDAAHVFSVMEGFDAEDPYSRPVEAARRLSSRLISPEFRVGVPRADQLQFFGDVDYAHLFDAAKAQIQAIGGQPVEIDFEPYLQAARLLYEGPWVAERYAAIQSFIERQPQSLHPVTYEITAAGKSRTAVQAFQAQYRLQALKRRAEQAFAQADVILTPTAGTIYRIEEVLADPFGLNSNLGYYTNFMNLLDLAAVAVPAGRRRDGLPFGITLFSKRNTDEALLVIAEHLQTQYQLTLGATDLPTPAKKNQRPRVPPGYSCIAACGAHMSGLPLNHQLTERGGILIEATHTAPLYRFYALPGGPPHRPGLIRVADNGASIAVEVWALPTEHLGAFIAAIPAPLGIGQIELQNGNSVSGFICESYAAQNARDISEFGGWRAYLARG